VVTIVVTAGSADYVAATVVAVETALAVVPLW
jgi:hypothetical protein